jgi:hypothetical protein
MLAALMIGHHFSMSAFCNRSRASGVCWSRGGISCSIVSRGVRSIETLRGYVRDAELFKITLAPGCCSCSQLLQNAALVAIAAPG